MHKRPARRTLPLLPVFLLLGAASTGTVLASDACKISIVKTFTDTVQSVDRHTEHAHHHTKQTLQQWEEWGNLYLAKHGHPYVPPKKTVAADKPLSAEELARFKLECDVPDLPLIDLTVFPLLPTEELLPVWTEVELAPEEASLTPGPAVPDIPTFYPNQPVIFGTGTPPPITAVTPTPPIGVTPEPGSWVLLGTGIVAVLGSRKMLQRAPVA